MIGRKSIVGLVVLSALAIAAFAAQGAQAAFEANKNTTAFTCVEEKGLKDYKDAHCDSPTTPGEGKFGHVAIPVNTPTAITATNEGTGKETKNPVKAVLNSKVAGAEVRLTATTVHGEGTIENVSSGTEHQIKGSITVKYTNVTVDGLAGCKVKEPIEVPVNIEGVKQGTEMGLKFTPKTGETFTEIELLSKTPETCALNGQKLVVKGTAIGTAGATNSVEQTEAKITETIAALNKAEPGHVEATDSKPTDTTRPEANGSGATVNFEPQWTMQNLAIGPNKAYFWSHTTVKMKEGGPIVATTAT